MTDRLIDESMNDDQTLCERLARDGYEIHGRKHERAIHWAWTRGFMVASGLALVWSLVR